MKPLIAFDTASLGLKRSLRSSPGKKEKIYKDMD